MLQYVRVTLMPPTGSRSRWKMRSTAAGIHLFDRGSGLNVLLDEITPPTSQWAKAPRYVSISLTNACDLSCAYCYAPKRPAALNADMVSVWLDELDRNGCLGVGFGGGEPTLHPRFAELCRFAASNTTLAVTFTTHAHHIDDRFAAALDGSVHFVRVSMDGVAATYEHLRGRSFASFVDRVKLIGALFNFGINFVVNALTFPDLDRAIAIATELGARDFLLLPQQRTSVIAAIDDRTSADLRSWVHRYRGPLPLLISESAAEGIPYTCPIPNEAPLDAYAHIDASGLLKRTSFDTSGITITSKVVEALSLLRATTQENAS